jgi:hypothetical protein
MRTKVELEAWSSYYEYDDGTRDAMAGLFSWPTELDLPFLQRGVDLQLNGRACGVAKATVMEDGSQVVRCRLSIGYNRFREPRFADLREWGWTLTKEF